MTVTQHQNVINMEDTQCWSTVNTSEKEKGSLFQRVTVDNSV